MLKLNKIYECRVQATTGDFVVIKPPITMEFNVERGILSGTNTLDIKFYNLSSQTRSQMFKDRQLREGEQLRNVQLYAGYEYDGFPLSMIFQGRINLCNSERRGPEYITSLESSDYNILNYSQLLTINMGQSVSKADIIKQIYSSMGFANGIVGDKFKRYANTAQRAQIFFGSGIGLLNDIAIEVGGDAYFDLGRPIMLGDDEYFVNPSFTELSVDTGLLNVPKRSEQTVIAQMLFTPQILAGQKLTLTGYQDTQYNGDWKVVGIKHSGMISATHDGPTITTVTLYNPSKMSVISEEV